jgi:O-antigen ligase
VTLLVNRFRGVVSRTGFTSLDLAVVGVAAAALFSWLASEHAPNSLAATINAFLPLAFYPAARVLEDSGRLKLLWAMAAGGAVASLSLFYELLVTHAPLFANRDSYYWSAKGDLIFRPGGTLGSPPGAVAVLAMTAFAGVAVLGRVQGSRRLLAWTFVVLSVGGACITFTRAGLIGLALGAALYVALAKPGSLLRVGYVVGAVVVVGALLVLPRVENAVWYQSCVLRKGDFAIRQAYWKDAWPVIFNSPTHAAVGHGINSLLVGTSAIPGTPSPDIASNPTLSRFSPHNQYVRTLVEQGVVGLGLLLAWLGTAVAVGFRLARRASGANRGTIAALVGAGASFLVVSFANDSLRHIPTLAVIAAVTGLICAFRVEAEHE